MDVKRRAPIKVFSRLDIERLIAAGNILVIHEGYVLRLNAWQDYHPGGRLVIQHMVGRDATDEITISHSPDIVSTMHRYRIGRIDDQQSWVNFTPPIQGGNFRKLPTELDEKLDFIDQGPPPPTNLLATTDEYTKGLIQAELEADLAKYPSLDQATQREITDKFRALHRRVQDEGFYNTRYSEYAKEILRYSILFSLMLFFLHMKWYLTSALAMGAWWHQIMFTAHDAGHRGITHNFVIDALIGIFIANFCSGLSIGWWKSSHNVHHLITNDPVHDPDIQNVPIFATSPAFFTSIKSTYFDGFCYVWDKAADFLVSKQKYTYYPIMAVARFNLYILSWSHLLSQRSTIARGKGTASWTAKVEIIGIVFYFYVFGYQLLWRSIPTWFDRILFVLVSHLITMPLHVQITLSHWSTSTSDLGPNESFPQRQLRTTMDVACPGWLDFLHGGLQFQAVHHLFPRVPRHNLRKLQVLVKEFCDETKIEHLELGFKEGNMDVLGKLEQVAQQARLMAKCQKYMAETGESGLH